jgi:hypothetical protein
MALIKKIDVDEYFAKRRATRLGRLGLVSQPGVAGFKSEDKRERVPASVDALTLGDSSPGVSSASVSVMFDSGRNRLLRPPRSRQG